MKNLVFLLEEPSAREMLLGVLPRLVPGDIQFRFIVFQGKQDLERNLESKLRGWLMPDSLFIVIRDQDSGNCLDIKTNLKSICTRSGKENVLIRIACRELESFYLGDLAAIEKGLGIKGLKRHQQGKKFRAPDALGNPSEELIKITNNKYYKISGSRLIAPHLSLTSNKSTSFNVLLSGLKKLTAV
jgi:hypothetical protein